MFLQEQHSLSKHVFFRNNTLSNHISPGTTSLKACFSGNNLSQSMFLQEQHSLKACFSRNTTLSLSKHVSPGTPLSLKACFSRNTTLSQSVFLQEQPLSKQCFFRNNTLTCFSNRQKKKKKKKKGSTVKTGIFIYFLIFFVKYNAPLILLVFDVKSYLDNCITVMVTWALITNRRISLCLLSAGKVHLLPSGSVVLTDLDPSDTGNYTCVAVNPVSGHNRSATYVISLTVTPKSQGQCVVSDGRVSQARLVLTPVASVVVWSGWVRLGRLVLICQSRLVVSGRDSALCGWVFCVWVSCLVCVPRLTSSGFVQVVGS